MKVNRLYAAFLLAAAALCSSCAKRSLPPDEYSKWIQDEENGLKVKKAVGAFEFTVLYKPHEFIAAYENWSNASEKSVNRTKEELGDVKYFNFQIGAKDGVSDVLELGLNSYGDFQKRLEYFSFGMQEDLFLVIDGDSMPCNLFQFDRTYQLSPYQTFVVGFPYANASKEEKEMQFIYKDEVLGVGTIKMSIKEDDLNKIPQLQL